jgi:hypothetical protein
LWRRESLISRANNAWECLLGLIDKLANKKEGGCIAAPLFFMG